MTRTQRTLYALLIKQNRLSKDAGEHYLPSPDDTFRKIAEIVDDETAAWIVKDDETGVFDNMLEEEHEMNERDGEPKTERIQFLLWLIYMRNSSRDAWGPIRRALAGILEQYPAFFRAAQNRITNALPDILRNGIQLDLNKDGTAIVGNKKNDKIIYRFSGMADEVNGYEVDTTALMLLDSLLIKLADSSTPSVVLTLEEYADIRNKSTDKGSIDSLRRQVVRDLRPLFNLSARYREKINGRWVDSGDVGICGGTAIVRDKTIYFNFNADLFNSLKRFAPTDLSRETLAANPRTSVYYFSRYLDQNYRINEGKSRLSRIKISTLLSKTPKIPSIEYVRENRYSAKQKIIVPFFRDMDDIDRIGYEVYDQDGHLVEDPLNMSYEDFYNASLEINYEEYPEHQDRVKRRKKREKKAAIIRKAKADKKKAEEKAAAEAAPEPEKPAT